MADIKPWLNYHHLQYFAAVVEEGGIAAAANRVGVSHPTISEQIKRLEEQLHMKLFERRGRRLALTADGEMVYEYAAQIFGLGEALIEAVHHQGHDRTVLARIGVDSVLAKLAVRRALSPLWSQVEQGMRLRIVEEHQERLLQSLRTRQLDLVLSDGPAPNHLNDELCSSLIDSSPLSFYAIPSLSRRLRPEFPKSLHGAPLIMPLSPTRIRRDLNRWFEEQGLKPHVVAEVEDSGLVKALGQDGLGVFVMPDSLRESVMDHYEVEVVGRAEKLLGKVYLIVSQQRMTSPLAAAILTGAEVSPPN